MAQTEQSDKLYNVITNLSNSWAEQKKDLKAKGELAQSCWLKIWKVVYQNWVAEQE
jgi:hypothetical protein